MSPRLREEEQQGDDGEQHQGEGAHRRFPRRPRRPHLRPARERHAGMAGDHVRDGRHGVGEPLAVIALFEQRDDVEPENLAGDPVGKDALDAVARLDPHPPLFQGEQDEHPLVLPSLSDTPGLVEAGCVIIGRPVPHGGHRGDDDGRSRLLQDLPGEALHGFTLGHGDHAGKVVDGPQRPRQDRVRRRNRPCEEHECKQQKKHRGQATCHAGGSPFITSQLHVFDRAAAPVSEDRPVGSGR